MRMVDARGQMHLDPRPGAPRPGFRGPRGGGKGSFLPPITEGDGGKGGISEGTIGIVRGRGETTPSLRSVGSERILLQARRSASRASDVGALRDPEEGGEIVLRTCLYSAPFFSCFFSRSVRGGTRKTIASEFRWALETHAFLRSLHHRKNETRDLLVDEKRILSCESKRRRSWTRIRQTRWKRRSRTFHAFACFQVARSN